MNARAKTATQFPGASHTNSLGGASYTSPPTRRSSPLQAVVTVREQQEQAALQIYVAATRDAEVARRRLQGLTLEIQSAAVEFQQRIARGCTAGELAQVETHFERLEVRRARCEEAIRFADEALNKALSCWHAARQAREIVEEHIARLARRARRIHNRKEQKASDDLAATRKLWRQRAAPL